MYTGIKTFNVSGYEDKCENCPLKRMCIHTAQSLLRQKCDNRAKMFLDQLPNKLFTYNIIGQYSVNYMQFENCLVEYCRINYPSQLSTQSIWNGVQYVLVPANDSYEKNIREIFKKEIDYAAHITKEKMPELSIMFEGMGLVLADDIVEAVSKIISILETGQKINFGDYNYGI